jgi:histone H3/H4
MVRAISLVEGTLRRLGRRAIPTPENQMAKKSQEPLVIASKAKGVLKAAGCNTAGDAFAALNGYLYWLLEQAAKRAKANGRKTVRAHDFMV